MLTVIDSKNVYDVNLQTRNLRRSTCAHTMQIRQMLAETIVKIGDISTSLCNDKTDSVC